MKALPWIQEFAGSSTLRLAPPLNLTEQQAATFLDALPVLLSAQRTGDAARGSAERAQ